MTLSSDALALVRVIRRALTRRKLRASLQTALEARQPLPTGHFEAVVYFADKTVNMYQIRQWYEPMRRLAEKHPVAVIGRSLAATELLLEECPLPVFYGPTIGDIENFVATQNIKIAFYVNQNMRNFQMMRFPGMFHVFVSHGESDKIYMASNQVKAYDYFFVAGDASIERIEKRLLAFDSANRLIPIGRPQVDVVEAGPGLPDDDRLVVLYAPTWEGDRPSMTYGSVLSHGVALVKSLVESGRHRVIYRPHPRTGVFDPAQAHAHQQIVKLLTGANRHDPAAGHVVDTESTFGWHLRAADFCIADISAVAFDWLAVGKPMLLTEPVAEEAEVDPEGIAGKVPLLKVVDAPAAAAIVDELSHGDARELYGSITEHYFGDMSPGNSMRRFLAACDQVMGLRDAATAALGQEHRVIDLTALERAPGVPESSVPLAHVAVVGDEEGEGLDGFDA